jgi:hypothetical protein
VFEFDDCPVYEWVGKVGMRLLGTEWRIARWFPNGSGLVSPGHLLLDSSDTGTFQLTVPVAETARSLAEAWVLTRGRIEERHLRFSLGE